MCNHTNNLNLSSEKIQFDDERRRIEQEINDLKKKLLLKTYQKLFMQELLK